MRLDKYLQQKFPNFSRSKISNFIKRGRVLVNDLKVKSGYFVKPDDEFKFFFEEQEKFESSALKLEILYEDKGCFVINKPSGLVVHPGEGSQSLSGTLANALIKKVGKNFPGSIRPGIVHRLDKDTSGLMIIAKNQKAYNDLIDQFRNRTVKKMYVAMVLGKMSSSEGLVEASIARASMDRKRMAVVAYGGKAAISVYKVKSLFRYKDYFLSFVQVEIKSGRTHQIRVHFASIGHSVVGDGLYGSKKMNKYFGDRLGFKRQFLHACELRFQSPDTKKEVNLKIKLPSDLNSIMQGLAPFKIDA